MEYVLTKRELQLAAQKTIYDDVNGDGSLVYSGQAAQGSALDDEVWFISKTVVAGVVTTVTHSDPSYSSEWDERAGTVTYS